MPHSQSTYATVFSGLKAAKADACHAAVAAWVLRPPRSGPIWPPAVVPSGSNVWRLVGLGGMQGLAEGA